MSYARLLVAVDDRPESDRRLELAFDLAEAFEAEVHGLCAVTMAPELYDPYAGAPMVGEWLTLQRDLAEDEIKRARSRFLRWAEDRKASNEWTGLIDYPAAAFCRTSALADLVVLGAGRRATSYIAPDVADVVMGSGRPVLVTPDGRSTGPLGSPALIAWKNTREARRALSAAIPLLQRSSEVVLYRICPAEDREDEERELAALQRYLKAHRIDSDAVVALKDRTPAGQRLLEEASRRRVGLIVAGAYGHPRLQEWALGGVTRALLTDAEFCFCLTH